MRITQINLEPAPQDCTAAEVFQQWPSLADIPEAAASSGIDVSVIQAARHQERVTRGGVDYHFTDICGLQAVNDRGEHFARLINGIKTDVLHVHGLGFAEDAFAIAHYLPHLPILIQDHANRPPRWWRRWQWRRWYAAATGVTFTTTELAQPFQRAGLFHPQTRLFAIPESSCRFTVGDCAQARSETGLYGDPCVLWVGHLKQGKDPLTVLDGFAQAAAQLPGLQLWCAYGSELLLADVQERVARDPRLHGRVHLLGKVPHTRIERLMQTADIFVSGSLGESCGYALLEALACGVVPVVTDIPSFRMLTAEGRIGALWPCGDPARLADALVSTAKERPSRAQVRAYFDDVLSFAAVGRQWAGAYAQVLDDRQRELR